MDDATISDANAAWYSVGGTAAVKVDTASGGTGTVTAPTIAQGDIITIVNTLKDSSANESIGIVSVSPIYGLWTHQAYLKAPNAKNNDQFGGSFSIDGNTAIVGALTEDSSQTTITNGTTASADNSAGNAGAAYVFVRDSW
ncbi:MAG: FG-GAP repeat protein [Spirochaetia bacterium]|nr:FG-GAP repeat protein [Spirochaetia bacterium]